MSDVQKGWWMILDMLDLADRVREPQRAPLIVTRGAHQDRDAIFQGMRSQTATDAHRSGHRCPLVWQLRVDKGQILGLAFLELAIPIPDGSDDLKTASLRLVTGVKHPGWVLEALGPVENWSSGNRLFANFAKFAKDEVTTTSRSSRIVPFPQDRVARAINDLIQEADRVEELFKKILTGE